jgi:hypothetical protein
MKFSDSLRRRICPECQHLPEERTPKFRRARKPYVNAHRAVVRERGKATDHACYKCSGLAHEWAFIHDEHRVLSGYFHAAPYGPPESYEPLCRKCHRAMDADRTKNGVNDGEVFMFMDGIMAMLTGKPVDSRDGSAIVRPDLQAGGNR